MPFGPGSVVSDALTSFHCLRNPQARSNPQNWVESASFMGAGDEATGEHLRPWLAPQLFGSSPFRRTTRTLISRGARAKLEPWWCSASSCHSRAGSPGTQAPAWAGCLFMPLLTFLGELGGPRAGGGGGDQHQLSLVQRPQKPTQSWVCLPWGVAFWATCPLLGPLHGQPP